MTKNKRFSVINLIIYLAVFVGDVALVGIVKDEMVLALNGAFGDGALGQIAVL